MSRLLHDPTTGKPARRGFLVWLWLICLMGLGFAPAVIPWGSGRAWGQTDSSSQPAPAPASPSHGEAVVKSLDQPSASGSSQPPATTSSGTQPPSSGGTSDPVGDTARKSLGSSAPKTTTSAAQPKTPAVDPSQEATEFRSDKPVPPIQPEADDLFKRMIEAHRELQTFTVAWQTILNEPLQPPVASVAVMAMDRPHGRISVQRGGMRLLQVEDRLIWAMRGVCQVSRGAPTPPSYESLSDPRFGPDRIFGRILIDGPLRMTMILALSESPRDQLLNVIRRPGKPAVRAVGMRLEQDYTTATGKRYHTLRFLNALGRDWRVLVDPETLRIVAYQRIVNLETNGWSDFPADFGSFQFQLLKESTQSPDPRFFESNDLPGTPFGDVLGELEIQSLKLLEDPTKPLTRENFRIVFQPERLLRIERLSDGFLVKTPAVNAYKILTLNEPGPDALRFTIKEPIQLGDNLPTRIGSSINEEGELVEATMEVTPDLLRNYRIVFFFWSGDDKEEVTTRPLQEMLNTDLLKRYENNPLPLRFVVACVSSGVTTEEQLLEILNKRRISLFEKGEDKVWLVVGNTTNLQEALGVRDAVMPVIIGLDERNRIRFRQDGYRPNKEKELADQITLLMGN